MKNSKKFVQTLVFIFIATGGYNAYCMEGGRKGKGKEKEASSKSFNELYTEVEGLSEAIQNAAYKNDAINKISPLVDFLQKNKIFQSILSEEEQAKILKVTLDILRFATHKYPSKRTTSWHAHVTRSLLEDALLNKEPKLLIIKMLLEAGAQPRKRTLSDTTYNIDMDPKHQNSNALELLKFFLLYGAPLGSVDHEKHYEEYHKIYPESDHYRSGAARITATENSLFLDLPLLVLSNNTERIRQALRDFSDIIIAENKTVQAIDPEADSSLYQKTLNFFKKKFVKELPKQPVLNINERDFYGMTALQWAAARGNLTLVNILLEDGASFALRTPEGLTAIELAERYSHPEVANLIRLYARRTLVRQGLLSLNIPEELIAQIAQEDLTPYVSRQFFGGPKPGPSGSSSNI